MNTYDPKAHSLSFSAIPITGFAPDTFIVCERNEDSFSLKKGAAGEGVRVMNRNRSGKITFTLMHNSLSNDLLSALAAADELSGSVVAPALVKDNQGLSTAFAKDAWIMRRPNLERSQEAPNVEWVLECDDLEIFLGGIL